MNDVAILGGGPAGLQAALTLGRMHRSTVLIDSGAYRNAVTSAMHNLVTNDGRAPADFRTAARREIEEYASVTSLTGSVTSIAGTQGAFVLSLADGARVEARRVILATGVADALPAIPGLAEIFGDVVAHCPFCHGHEFADRRVGILGTGEHAARLAVMLAPIASEVVVLPGAATAPDALARTGALALPGEIGRVAEIPDGVEVTFADGRSERFAGLFASTAWRQAAPFADDLGLAVSESGGVLVDGFGRTSTAGVYAAGDIAQPPGLPAPLHSVATAISTGMLAAAACVQDGVATVLAE
jgi:thioredoxin reductase